ncbi:kelch repeat and BTB domain-containing protein 2-like [Branchiostoma floridae]|uniref:Kelch repeat and BTB domain-containing protein 2-like n=1 Tax=Branchiostoma floridae TaxID=7739 RepID=A0A9J7LVF9_BRAFL|nr:kelch repeat and BTB domain-containing protein 2-like [Branchiostoma floridae]
MFTSDMAESRQKTVVLQGLDAGMLREILSYIYSGTLHVSLDKVQPLYQAADLLQLDYVRDSCSSYMAMSVERSTCVDLYKFADVFSVENVRKACQKWIARHFTEVASSEFCSLSVNNLIEIISHDELDVKEETTVWKAVVRWVQHRRKDRMHHLPTILSHIRFNLLTSDDTAAILEHPLVREDPGSCEVIKNVVKKGNPNLKPRLGMTTEMVLLLNQTPGHNEVLFMNPQEGKYISCSYKYEDLPEESSVETVTTDNDIYIMEIKYLEDEKKLSLLKYNHAENVWEPADVPSISMELEHDSSCHISEIDGTLYYLPIDEDSSVLRMSKWDQHTKQWLECSSLQFEEFTFTYTFENRNSLSFTLSCGSHLYFLTNEEMHRYDPSQDRWSKRTPPIDIPNICTAVAMGTEIFCTDVDFTQTMVYDTESDCWHKLQGPENPDVADNRSPSFFVLGNQLHVLLICVERPIMLREGHLVYVYDRSADAWRDLKATLPNRRYDNDGPHWPVARIYLPYLKGA